VPPLDTELGAFVIWILGVGTRIYRFNDFAANSKVQEFVMLIYLNLKYVFTLYLLSSDSF
jgi:hypothetical protein